MTVSQGILKRQTRRKGALKHEPDFLLGQYIDDGQFKERPQGRECPPSRGGAQECRMSTSPGHSTQVL